MPFGERFKGCFWLGFYMYLCRGCVWNCSITWWHRREECSGVFSPSSLHMRVPVSVLTAADSNVSFVLRSLLSRRVPPDKYRKDLEDGKLNFPRIERRSVLFLNHVIQGLPSSVRETQNCVIPNSVWTPSVIRHLYLAPSQPNLPMWFEVKATTRSRPRTRFYSHQKSYSWD